MTLADEDIRPNIANDGILLNFYLIDTLNRHPRTSLMAKKKKLSFTSSPNESIVNASPK